MKRIYRAICRRWGPDGLTLSAAAHVRAMAGRPFWRDLIDGWWLRRYGERDHCMTCHQTETQHLTKQ